MALMSERAAQILKRQFAEWIAKGKWHAGDLADLSSEEHDEDYWYRGGKPPSFYLHRITGDPDELASEVKQIGFDGGFDKMASFIIEYGRRLRRARVPGYEIDAAMADIDAAEEHSH